MKYAHLKPEKLLQLNFLNNEGILNKNLYFNDKDDFLYWFKEYDAFYIKKSVMHQRIRRVHYHLTWANISRIIYYLPSGKSYEIRSRKK